MSKAIALVRPHTDDEKDLLDNWVNAKPKKRDATRRLAWFRRVFDEANVMRNHCDWSRARPAHLVALYAWCHDRVYNVAAEDLVKDVRMFLGATRVAEKFVREQFGREDDEGIEPACERAVDFVRWTWGREMAREKRVREGRLDGRRLGWRLQFSGAIVTDYKLALARKGEEIR